MGAACYICADPGPAPPPYEEPGYKPSHHGTSKYSSTQYQPTYSPPPPSYAPRSPMNRYAPVAATSQVVSQRKVSNSTQRKATNQIQQKAANSTYQKAASIPQKRVENRAVTSDSNSVHYEVMILGLPKADGHTPHVSATLVAAALGTSIADGDIIDAYRIPGNGRRAQPLIIKFSSIELRDRWISLKKKKQQLFARQVHPACGNEKVFVVERLTPENQALFDKVKEFSRQNNYRFVWTEYGNIMIRKMEGVDGYTIRCAGDLNNLPN